jgi:hypothetical protein
VTAFSAFPQELRFIPIQGVKSFRAGNGAGGAWRAFILAKNLAGNLDHVERERVEKFALSLGVHSKTFDRWLNAARVFGLVRDVQRAGGEWILVLISHENATKTLGHKERRSRFVSLPARLLVGSGWKSYVFAAWQAQYTANGERLVSQKKQAEITGVSEQVQRQYNKGAGVKSKRNYAVSNIHANGYSGVLEFGNRAGLFKFWNKKTHTFYLGWRVPNSRVFPLLGASGFQKTRKTMSLFNKTEAQYAATKKTLRKTKTAFREFYVYYRDSKNGNGLWSHFTV